MLKAQAPELCSGKSSSQDLALKGAGSLTPVI